MNNNSKNGVLVALLVIAIIIICGLVYYVFNIKAQYATKTSELENNPKTSESTITEDVSDNISEDETTTSSDKEVTTTNSSKEDWNGDITKVDFSNLKKEGCQYEDMGLLLGVNDYAVFIIQNGEVSISVTKKVKNLINDISFDEIGYTEFSKYDDFSNRVKLNNISDVKYPYFGAFGQDFWNETPVLFLMNDGTIKYDTFEHAVENKLSPETIPGLKDIVAIYSSSVADVDEETGERMGGAMTSIAVDKNGIAYDIDNYLKQ